MKRSFSFVMAFFGAILFLSITPFLSFVEAEGPVAVMLDPGHGRSDPGWIPSSGSPEKDAVLELAKLVGAGLRQRGWSVDMTRTRDRLPTEQVRLSDANRSQCQAFLSLHLSRDGRVHVLVQRPVRDAVLSAAAERVVAAGGRATLLDLAQNRFRQESRGLAEHIAAAWEQKHPGSEKPLVFEAEVGLLAGIAAPAVLIEVPPVSPSSRQKSDDSFDSRAVDSLIHGVNRFLAEAQQ